MWHQKLRLGLGASRGVLLPIYLHLRSNAPIWLIVRDNQFSRLLKMLQTLQHTTDQSVKGIHDHGSWMTLSSDLIIQIWQNSTELHQRQWCAIKQSLIQVVRSRDKVSQSVASVWTSIWWCQHLGWICIKKYKSVSRFRKSDFFHAKIKTSRRGYTQYSLMSELHVQYLSQFWGH